MSKKTQNDEPIFLNVGDEYTKMENFVNENRQTLTYGLGGLAVVILAVLGYQSFVVRPAEVAAEEGAWRAENYFQMDSLNLAAYGDGYDAGLEEILNEHSGTNAAERAAYELGIVYRDNGQFEEAIEAFANAGLDDGIIGALAECNIGDCKVELGQYNDAVSHFDAAARMAASDLGEDVLTPLFLFKAAVAKIETGDTRGAKEDLDRIVEDYPNSQQYNTAVGMSASLAKS